MQQRREPYTHHSFSHKSHFLCPVGKLHHVTFLQFSLLLLGNKNRKFISSYWDNKTSSAIPTLKEGWTTLMCNYTRAKVHLKRKKQQQNQKKLFVKCRIGGFIKNQPTMIIRLEAKWHSHHGHHTRDMVQQVHYINKPWNRGSHHEPACPRFAPLWWMAS